ncbi:unnamed protein product [Vicia faba]|uniref:NAC domain-containing protein n=1 Tax=Vicia faba TaxID=3906 RepID=A0AAV0ZEY5_VICFA|nr:unnamed protein product [Vicia faba]
MSLYQAPGFRFHPTDEEIVCFYLKRKLTGNLPFRFDHLAVIDIYKFEPWDLPSLSKLKNKDLEWYFFTVLDKKYGNSLRTNRTTDRGYWKTTGKDRVIKNGQDTVGMKKTLVYHLGRAPHGDRSNWVMHEYRMIDEELAKAGVQDAYVLCRIFEKSGPGPKNGEKYGAPFVEAEWENIIDGRQVYPLTAVDSEHSTDKVPAHTDDDYFETNDLDQELDTCVTFGSADLPSNFCYGECSSHSQAFINDHKQFEAALGIYNSQIDQPNNMADLYGVDINSVQDGYNEYVDTNDVKNIDGAITTEIDPSVAAILDEYLACPDEDISKYICFDSPLNVESESPIANYGQSFIEQNVEGETNGSTLANQHVDAQSSSEIVLPKEDLKASNWVSGDANAFVMQANNLLARIPAPPVFASEFPAKEFAIGMHPATVSSSSAHITAGMSMISITDITFGGNAMDWMVGKNGGFHTIMSSGFPQTDVNSATLVPTSGLVCSKTAFMLSHGWVFLMGFSVVILSLSFKIGSFMYTVK